MKTFFLNMVLLLTISCSKSDNSSSFSPQTITPVIIGKGNLFTAYNNNAARQNILITNSAEWQTFKTTIDNGNPGEISNTFYVTNIDFDVYEVIAIIDSVKLTGGYTIDVTNIVENQTNITFTIQNLQNGDLTQVVNFPFHIVKIPKSTKPLVFQ